MKKKLLISIILAVALLLIPVSGVFAATSQNVTVTATPAYIAIANAPSTWTINDVAGAGGKTIAVNTQYYSNPLGDTTVPSDPVVDGECRFTVTNTSSVAIDLTVNFPDHANGDASTNSNDGTNLLGTFGAYSYCTGMTYSSGKVLAKASGSSAMKSGLAATTNIKWGLAYKSQSNAWTSGTAMTSTVVITATASS
jgi:hypothetical protein